MSREARERLEELQVELRALRGTEAPRDQLELVRAEVVAERRELEARVSKLRKSVTTLELEVERAKASPLTNRPSWWSSISVLAPLYLVVTVPLLLGALLVWEPRVPMVPLVFVAVFGAWLARRMSKD
ncbi:MAG: hypothetical protein U0228_00070 [Myxococcaceae bacterium]